MPYRYFQIRCETCKETFQPLASTTSPEELLFPDYEICEEQVGNVNSERLRDFHKQHWGHELIGVTV